jgi:predicted O-methyltransferase YrrM
MGVELASPLIYSLIRFVRPRSLLEIGAGYSSAFILQAIADNVSDVARESEIMKTQARGDQQDRVQWLKNKIVHGRHPLPLAVPEYYQVPHEPTLTIIDNMSHSSGTAGQVQKIADRLGLNHLLHFQKGDFRGMSKSLPERILPLDFVWFDCGAYEQYRAFLCEYWDLINPNGGLLILHSTLTNFQLRSIVVDLKLKQATDHFNKFEMLSLLEPHKWRQNSVTLIRMLPKDGEKVYTAEP